MFGNGKCDPGPGGRPTEGPTPGAAGVTERVLEARARVAREGPRLGMFGGSFDPIHMGHLHAAAAARDAFGLERVIFVPAGQPPHKLGRRLAPGVDRLEMVRLAIRGQAGFEASDMELAREGPSYTFDTLVRLRRRWLEEQPAQAGEQPELSLYLIMGSDNLPDLPRWYRAEELLELAQPIIVLRALDPIPEAAWFEELAGPARARIERGLLRLAPAPGRSTDLRLALARGERAPGTLPEGVWEYIREHGLYRAEPCA